MQQTNILELANKAAIARAKRSELTQCYYDWENEKLLAKYNKGRQQFEHKLDTLVNHPDAIPFDPWSHVGKNH